MVCYQNKDELAATFKPNSSPVDWCEANYEVTPYVSEFWNSASATLLFSPGFLGYYAYKNTRGEKHEPNLYLVWMCILISAAGSCYFHSSLSVAGQVLDEMPLIILAVYGIALGIPANKWPSQKYRNLFYSWKTLLCANIGMLLISLLKPHVSHILVLAAIPFASVAPIVGFYFCKDKPWDLMKLFVVFWFLAFSCWFADKLACEETTAFFMSTIGFYP